MERDGDGGDDELDDEEDETESDEFLNLTEELLRRFERNDPSLTSLTVQSEGWILGAGIVFAQCKFLKSLHIVLSSDIRWFAELCTGIINNKTIEDLLLVFDLGGGGGGADTLRLLAPFLQNNLNLRSLQIINNHDGPMDTKLGSLTSIFKGRKSGLLKKMCISWNSASDDEAAALVESLGGQHNLRHLCFSTDIIEKMACKSLGYFMERPDCKVHTLDLCGIISADCFYILCYALTKNSTLQHLYLSDIKPFSVSNCISLSMIFSRPFTTLKELQIGGNDLGDEGISILGYALSLNTTLQHLDLNNSRSITKKGWQAFSTCLRNPESALEKLILWGCRIGDQGLAAFTTALRGNSNLSMLDLDHNGFESEEAFALIHVLLDSTFLAVLCIDSIGFDNINEEEWCYLSRALCDKTSIHSTFSSNHTFHTWEVLESMDSHGSPHENVFNEVCTMMGMNGFPNKTAVARRKILDNHFLHGNTGFHALACMHETVLPNAIEWMGRDELGYSVMFEFVCGYPTVFDANSSGAHRDCSKKRKLA